MTRKKIVNTLVTAIVRYAVAAIAAVAVVKICRRKK